jgi:hypothetical protein
MGCASGLILESRICIYSRISYMDSGKIIYDIFRVVFCVFTLVRSQRRRHRAFPTTGFRVQAGDPVPAHRYRYVCMALELVLATGTGAGATS